MQLDPQTFLRLVESNKTLACVDIEATGLRGDYNSILVASVRPFGSKPFTFKVTQAGNDQKVVRELKECMESMDCWVTYYGKGFDIPMINTRLLKWHLEPLVKRPHIDMYYIMKYHTLTARRSQGHIMSWLKSHEGIEIGEKMTVGADTWNEVLHDTTGKAMKNMVARCESDVEGLESLYNRTKHLIGDIKR